MRTDGLLEIDPDTAKLIVTFHNIANSPNKKKHKSNELQCIDKQKDHSDYNKQSLTDC
jgi:hypothetical protein